jgi:hypothetical protein
MMNMKFKTLTLALTLLLAGTTVAQAAVHETPQPEAPAVVGKATASHAASKKHKASKQAKKRTRSNKKNKGAKNHGKTGAHKSTSNVH